MRLIVVSSEEEEEKQQTEEDKEVEHIYQKVIETKGKILMGMSIMSNKFIIQCSTCIYTYTNKCQTC